MLKFLRYVIYALLLPAFVALAEEGGGAGEAKVESGMSIVGNNETPKSLYLVPWKTSEVGKVEKFVSGISREELSPIDKNDFMRELDFYKQSNPN